MKEKHRNAFYVGGAIVAAIVIISVIVWLGYPREAEGQEKPKQAWKEHIDDAGSVWACSTVKPTTCVLIQAGPGVIVPKGIQQQGVAL